MGTSRKPRQAGVWPARVAVELMQAFLSAPLSSDFIESLAPDDALRISATCAALRRHLAKQIPATTFALTRLSTLRVRRSLKDWGTIWSACADFVQHEGSQAGAWADSFHALVELSRSSCPGKGNCWSVKPENLVPLVNDIIFYADEVGNDTDDVEQSDLEKRELSDILAARLGIPPAIATSPRRCLTPCRLGGSLAVPSGKRKGGVWSGRWPRSFARGLGGQRRWVAKCSSKCVSLARKGLKSSR